VLATEPKYLAITRKKDGFLLEYGKEGVRVQIPNSALDGSEIKELENLKPGQNSIPNILRAMLPALGMFEKIYRRVPNEGGNIWGIKKRVFKPADIRINPVDDFNGESIPESSTREKGVVINISILKEYSDFATLIFTHEGSHYLFESIWLGGKTQDHDLEAKFLTAFDKLKEATNGITAQDVAVLQIDRRSAEHSSWPLFALLDESTYLNTTSGFGHPYDGESELFASGSAVLSHFPSEFFSNLSTIADKSPQDAQKILDAIDLLVRIHVGNGKESESVFPKEYFIQRKLFDGYMKLRNGPHFDRFNGNLYHFHRQFDSNDHPSKEFQGLLNLGKYKDNAGICMSFLVGSVGWEVYKMASYLQSSHKKEFISNLKKVKNSDLKDGIAEVNQILKLEDLSAEIPKKIR